MTAAAARIMPSEAKVEASSIRRARNRREPEAGLSLEISAETALSLAGMRMACPPRPHQEEASIGSLGVGKCFESSLIAADFGPRDLSPQARDPSKSVHEREAVLRTPCG